MKKDDRVPLIFEVYLTAKLGIKGSKTLRFRDQSPISPWSLSSTAKHKIHQHDKINTNGCLREISFHWLSGFASF